MNQQALESWKRELTTRHHSISQTEDDRYVRIRIGSIERFAVCKKSGTIYGVSRGRVKKSENYGDIRDWDIWSWTFFPYLKSNDNWRKNEAENSKKDDVKIAGERKTRQRIVPITEEYKSQIWPYTTPSCNPPGSTDSDDKQVGEDRNSVPPCNPRSDLEEGSRNIRKKGGRKKLRT